MTIIDIGLLYGFTEKEIKKIFSLKKILINGEVCLSLDYDLY